MAEPGSAKHDRTARVLSVALLCQACGQRTSRRFATGFLGADDGLEQCVFWSEETLASQPLATLNPLDEPSEVIDLAGWLTLHSMLGNKVRLARVGVDPTLDRFAIRRWQVLANLCVAEALKFYEPDNDLPPADAFFTEPARQQYKDHPALFLRPRLIDLRSALPIP